MSSGKNALGVNVIHTFCVSCDGYAWYRGSSVAPVEPGLKHDFLKEITTLAHRDGVKVMGYFCVNDNRLWVEKHPDQSQEKSHRPHIPLTNDYLDYLTASIEDVLVKTEIDGFQLDGMFSPDFLTEGGKIRWLACERKMYGELFDRPFPGEENVGAGEAVEFQRRALRCWRRIHDVAKATKPNCIVWLSSHNLKSPQTVGSAMLKECDWLVNENPDPAYLEAVRRQVGPHTKIIQCLCGWEEHDAGMIVARLKNTDVGFYGFARGEPTTTLPLEVNEAEPDVSAVNARNIAYLRKLFHEGR